jgi:hypothetical protein
VWNKESFHRQPLAYQKDYRQACLFLKKHGKKKDKIRLKIRDKNKQEDKPDRNHKT